MKDIILQHIIKKFGETNNQDNRIQHYSYCLYPEKNCTCKNLEEIKYDTSLINGGYIDSFSMVGVWDWLEKTFNVEIPDKEATPFNFDNVDRMTELVKKFKK